MANSAFIEAYQHLWKDTHMDCVRLRVFGAEATRFEPTLKAPGSCWVSVSKDGGYFGQRGPQTTEFLIVNFGIKSADS